MSLLESLAAEAPATLTGNTLDSFESMPAAGREGFDVAAFIERHNLDAQGPTDYEGGQKWTFGTSPLCDCSGGQMLTQFPSGAIYYKCSHNTCTSKNAGNRWLELRAKYEPTSAAPAGPASGLSIMSLGQLKVIAPIAEPHVVRNLIQACDVVNIIAPSKLGKTFYVAQQIVSYVAGLTWLGFSFGDATRKVLLIDDELKPFDIHNRIAAIAAKLGVDFDIIQNRIDVVSLRGNQRNVKQIVAGLANVLPGTYGIIVIDAVYRILGDDINENSNSDMGRFYNELEKIANRLKAAVFCVHHTSKGDQSEKSITDVGSGAGAISRAVDCHMILRPHEETDCFVLEFAVRNFKAPEPLVLRRRWPLWEVAAGLDPNKLRLPNQKPLPDFDTLWDILATAEGNVMDSRDLRESLRVQTGCSVVSARELLAREEVAGRLFRIPGENRTYSLSLINPSEAPQ